MVMFYKSSDQSFYPYKSQIRNHPFISNGNFLPSNVNTIGILQTPPPNNYFSHSYPPYLFQQSLLPLPTTIPRRNPPTRTFSSPPVNKNKYHSLTPKKSKSPTKNPKKEDKNLPKKSTFVSSTSLKGLNPKEVAKDVKTDLPFISTGNIPYKDGVFTNNLSSFNIVKDQVDMFSGSVVLTTISPPPSSLPLPTFSLRTKLSCRAEVAGIDTGATDNLRRLLRLH